MGELALWLTNPRDPGVGPVADEGGAPVAGSRIKQVFRVNKRETNKDFVFVLFGLSVRCPNNVERLVPFGFLSGPFV